MEAEKCVEAASMDTVSPCSINDLISSIYDCAINPDNWEHTLELMCKHSNFHCAAINFFDLSNKIGLIQKVVGVEDYWLRKYFENLEAYGEEIGDTRYEFIDKTTEDPLRALSRHVPRNFYINQRCYQEWMRPQNLVDMMQLIVMREPDRVCAVHFARHEQYGLINDQDLALGARLLPHLRRAITISNLLEVQSLRADSLQSVIAALATGILLLAEDGTIVGANSAAERIIERSPLVFIDDGRLKSKDSECNERLRLSLVAAMKGEASVVSRPSSGGAAPDTAITAYVLPLSVGSVRPALHKTAVAAMFIPAEESQQTQVLRADILGASYCLTEAEKRVAEAVADGKSSLDAAKLLGISENTIRSHLKHIFGKTGVTRQAELIALMNRLTPPVLADRVGQLSPGRGRGASAGETSDTHMAASER